MPKPNWVFRPEQWLERLVEKEIRKNPAIKDRTEAIHALIQKTTDLEAKLKVAEDDIEAWHSRADFLEAFIKKQGIRIPTE